MSLPTKPRWMVGLEELARRYRQLAQARRTITPTVPDAVADALDFVAGDLEAQARVLAEPTRMLTCEEWGAEQATPVTGKTVRRWVHRGELDHRLTPSGIRIPAGAIRIPRATQADADAPLAHAS